MLRRVQSKNSDDHRKLQYIWDCCTTAAKYALADSEIQKTKRIIVMGL